MKVVIINKHPKDFLGGSEIQCDLIANGLSFIGHKVIYLAMNGKINYDYKTSYTVIPVIRKGNLIARITIENEPDIIYWRFNKINCFFEFVKIIKQFSSIPIIFSISALIDVAKLDLRIFKTKFTFRELLSCLLRNIMLIRQSRGFKYVDAVISLNKDYLGKVNVKNQYFIPNSMKENYVPFKWDKPERARKVGNEFLG